MKFRNLLRNVFFAITACAVGLGLLAVSVHAQTTQPIVQKANIMARSTTAQSKSVASDDTNAIRPFQINIQEERLKDLRRRIAATQWPECSDLEFYDRLRFVHF